DVLRQHFARAIERVERLGKARRQAPFELRHRLRDGRCGKRTHRRNATCADSCGAQKLTTLHGVLPGRAFFSGLLSFPPSGISLARQHAACNKKPRRSGAFARSGSPAYPSLLPADWRAMKLSKLFSTTRNHSTCSLRKGFHESNTFLNLGFLA